MKSHIYSGFHKPENKLNITMITRNWKTKSDKNLHINCWYRNNRKLMLN